MERDTNSTKFIPLQEASVTEYKDIIPRVGDEQVFVFDIDETLYPFALEIKDSRHSKLHKHLESCGNSPEVARRICDGYSEKYGVPIKGLVKEFSLSPEEYKQMSGPDSASLSRVRRDEELRKALLGLEGRKFCMTNADARHARLALEALDLTDCFEGVFFCDYDDMEFPCKPYPSVYRIVDGVLGVEKKQNVRFFDDSDVNIRGALNHGWRAHLVTNENDLKSLLDCVE